MKRPSGSSADGNRIRGASGARDSGGARSLVVGALALVALGAALSRPALRMLQPDEVLTVATVEVVRGEVSDFVRATGKIESVREDVIRVNEPHRIERVLVDEGRRVTRGAGLLELGPVNPTQEQGGLEARKLSLEAAVVWEEAARRDYEVSEALFEAGAEAEARVVEKSSALEAASIERRDAARALDEARRRAGPGNAGGGRTIVAGMDGTVIEIFVREGAFVSVGQEVVRLADLDRLEVVAEVDEFDAARVEVGQGAAIVFEALAERSYSGEVLSIAPRVRAKKGRSVVPVRIRLVGESAGLRVGNSVDVQLVVARRSDVLEVPISALVDGEDESVWVVRDGKAWRTPVTTGLVGISDIEIVQGLAEGDDVIVLPDAGIHHGREVSIE